MSSVSLVNPMWIACRMRAVNECTRFFKSNRTAGMRATIGGCQCRHKQAVLNTMPSMVDWFVFSA